MGSPIPRGSTDRDYDANDENLNPKDESLSGSLEALSAHMNIKEGGTFRSRSKKEVKFNESK